MVRFSLDDLDAVCERKRKVKDDSQRLEYLSGWYSYHGDGRAGGRSSFGVEESMRSCFDI